MIDTGEPARLSGRLIITGPPGRAQVFKTKVWLDSLGVFYEEKHQENATFLVGEEFTIEARVPLVTRRIGSKSKEILHDLIRGMSPYGSTGVPEVYWNLALRLVNEVYGAAGVALLESAHKTYKPQYDANDKAVLHSLEKWEDGGNTYVGPDGIIDRLEDLFFKE